ncbi:hypothetical protein CC80DRAFT_32372 [Byssothecium circinans]|uniref:Rhodopsin domain-containing protein n=1 Tax=Byssothecium circinans TaxID=147558 RepID=A0A6A5U1J3_9PLEO|nr:hypothetical protein CC80DRAFT_32372 [Byssothecium circinans]
MRFALEELHITTNWLVKACLLILYRRIFPASTSKKERRYFTYTAACCLVSFLLVQGLLPIWCYPMNRYWINDAANTSCTSYHNHAIATLALESFTTVLVLIIPIPFIPTPRIYLLFTLLFLGLATLVTEILGRYRIISNPSSPAYLHWYMAETVTLISYANLPFLNSLFNAANNARFRHLSNASLSSWPRSYKDTPPPRAQRQRLNCMATIIDSPSPPRVQKMESTVSNMARLDAEDAWDDGSTTVSVPPMSVRKVSLNDPPPELEVYWSPRRHSTRDMDLEIARVDVKSSFR